MAKHDKLYRRGSGPYFYMAIVVLVFAMYSLTVAVSTMDKCGEGAPKSWVVFPPGWECTARSGIYYG